MEANLSGTKELFEKNMASEEGGGPGCTSVLRSPQTNEYKALYHKSFALVGRIECALTYVSSCTWSCFGRYYIAASLISD